MPPFSSSTSETGEVFEQTIRLKDPETEEEVDFRRITVVLDKPTRGGEGELHLLNDVPAEDADAVMLAELYRKRWTIEALFQEVTAMLQCEISTLGFGVQRRWRKDTVSHRRASKSRLVNQTRFDTLSIHELRFRQRHATLPAEANAVISTSEPLTILATFVLLDLASIRLSDAILGWQNRN